MERLTIKWKDKVYDTLDPIDIVDNEYSKINFEKILVKLGEYEDAEEQGVLLKLPCKVGSELYVIRKLCDGKQTRVIENVIANSFDLRALQSFVITSNGHRLNFSNFGKTVFLTREEAEKALADMGA